MRTTTDTPLDRVAERQRAVALARHYREAEGLSIAQIAQRFGANDIDGTIVEERIYHDAGATTEQGMNRKQLLRLIREAGCEPVERDTAYNRVERTASAFTVLV